MNTESDAVEQAPMAPGVGSRLRRVRARLGRLGSGWTAIVALGLALVLVGGNAVASTFASYFNAQTSYNGSTFSTGALTAPAGFTATPSGNSVDLAWSVGGNGNQQDVNGVDTTSSSACSPSNTFAPLSVLSSSATSYVDANHAGQSGVQAGDHYCYQTDTAYGRPLVTLATALTSGQTVTSLALSSLPAGVGSGDSIEISNGSGSSQVFVTSAAYTASSSQASVSVTSATANASYTTSSTASDVTSWTSWTTAAYASTQVGFAATSAVITNGGTAGTIDSGDTIAVTFNQPPSALPSTADPVCTFASANTILLGDATGTCTSATDAYVFGKLVISNTGSFTNSVTYAVSYAPLSGDTITLTIGASKTKVKGSYIDSTISPSPSPVPTWTFTPATSLVSATGSVAACTSNTHLASLCQPASTGSF
ncbi:MAG: hypothetical protein ACYCSF_08650 [Acidimicrobiales bacterium]